MYQTRTKACCIALAAVMAASVAWAAGDPIGALTADGRVDITGQSSTFTLQDQEYAYFSGDQISTGEDATAVVRLSDGLNVTFIGASSGRVTRDADTYHVDVVKGHIVMDAREGIDYLVTHNGDPIPGGESLDASDEPFVVSVPESGDARFYMPAQLDDDDGAAGGITGGLTSYQIAALLAIIGGAAYYIVDEDDEEGPSS
jgi:hypothetical protein